MSSVWKTTDYQSNWCLGSSRSESKAGLSRDSKTVKASISHAEITPKELEPALMTGLDGKLSPDTPWTHLRRGAAHRSRKPGEEERHQLMLPAIPVSSHARTVPGPASLGSDSTATSVSTADRSNTEEHHHWFRWTTIIVIPSIYCHWHLSISVQATEPGLHPWASHTWSGHLAFTPLRRPSCTISHQTETGQTFSLGRLVSKTLLAACSRDSKNSSTLNVAVSFSLGL